MNRLRKKFAALFVAAGLLTATGCSGEFEGIYDIPLPGGAELGDHPYRVTIHFADVLDLVPQSGVQVNNVTVGNVTNIELLEQGWNAKVTVEVNGDVDLPANTRAYVRQTSLLGEKYVQLEAPPRSKAHGELTDGAVIPIARTDRSVEAEEILGALSMLLNGGGVEQINSITEELNKALDGNAVELRALLENANTLVTKLDRQSENITNALDSLNQLSKTLKGQTGKIENALENLAPGLRVLEQQRDAFTRMLDALRNLSTVAVDTIQASRQDLIANLKALQPTLRKLADAGSDLPKALELLLTFPFGDQAVPSVKGDYFNLYATIDLNLDNIMSNLGRSRQGALHSLPILGDLIPEREGESPGAESPLPLPSSDSGQQGSSNAGGQPQRGEDAGSGIGGIFGLLNPGGGS